MGISGSGRMAGTFAILPKSRIKRGRAPVSKKGARIQLYVTR